MAEEERKSPIPTEIIENSMQNNWFETDPRVSDDEVSSMAIGIAGDVDDWVSKTHIPRKSVHEALKIAKEELRDFLDDESIDKQLEPIIRGLMKVGL